MRLIPVLALNATRPAGGRLKNVFADTFAATLVLGVPSVSYPTRARHRTAFRSHERPTDPFVPQAPFPKRVSSTTASPRTAKTPWPAPSAQPSSTPSVAPAVRSSTGASLSSLRTRPCSGPLRSESAPVLEGKHMEDCKKIVGYSVHQLMPCTTNLGLDD